MMGEINAWHLGNQRSHPGPLAEGAVAERESSTYLVWRNELAPCAQKHIHEFNMGLCVANGQTREQK